MHSQHAQHGLGRARRSALCHVKIAACAPVQASAWPLALQHVLQGGRLSDCAASGVHDHWPEASLCTEPPSLCPVSWYLTLISNGRWFALKAESREKPLREKALKTLAVPVGCVPWPRIAWVATMHAQCAKVLYASDGRHGVPLHSAAKQLRPAGLLTSCYVICEPSLANWHTYG